MGFLFVAVLALTCAGGGNRDKVRLRMDLRPGESYVFRLTEDQTLTQRIKGQYVEERLTAGGEYSFDVIAKDPDGAAQVQVTLERVFFKRDLLDFDSDEPIRNDAELAPIKKLIGQGFEMAIRPDGGITAVEGAGTLMARLTRYVEDRFDAPEVRAERMYRDGLEMTAMTIRRIVAGMTGDEAARELLARESPPCPVTAVAAGDSWRSTVTYCGGGLVNVIQLLTTGVFSIPLKEQRVWRMKKRAKGRAFLEMRAEVSENPDLLPIALGAGPGLKDLDYKVKGSRKGVMELDEETGLPWRSRSELHLTGTAELVGSGEPAGRPIELTLYSKVVCERIE